jgi:hypothetical protein
MPPQLAKPDEFVQPSLVQAWADFQLAVLLVRTKLDDKVHNGQPAYDAAAAKFQQSLEKCLGAIVLRLSRDNSDLVFLHKYLGQKNREEEESREDKRVRAIVGKCLQYVMRQGSLEGNIKARWREIESHVPDRRNAVLEEGKVVRLTRNAEYPYTDQKGEAVAPCIGYRGQYQEKQLNNMAKDVHTLFTALLKMREFSSIVGEFYT